MERNIEATIVIPTALADVGEMLACDPGRVLGDRCTSDGEVHIDLDVELGRGASARQAVTVQAGQLQATPTGFVLPLDWTPAGRERLFPSFVGQLTLGPDGGATKVTLGGHYVVPLGAMGRFGDGVVGRQLATRSIRALLERIAVRLSASTPRLPAPKPAALFTVDITEAQYSELYMG
jgi:hypothetical protein